MVLPDSLSYHVVFDAGRQMPQDWWTVFFPLGIVWVLLRFARRPKHKWFPIFRKVLVGFAVILTVLEITMITYGYVSLRRALEQGDVDVVEGIVTEFIPQKPHLKHPEQFVVLTSTGRHKYSYRSSLGTGGLNKSRGRIRNGLQVRITERNGVILRLEVARDGSGNDLTAEVAENFPEVDFLPEIFLRFGYTTHLGYSNGMALRFVDVVSDTRCPYRSSCPEPGDAVAIMEFFDSVVGKQPIRLELHTNRELYGPFADGDLVIDLTHLRPVPGQEELRSKDDYVARLKIGRTQRASD